MFGGIEPQDKQEIQLRGLRVISTLVLTSDAISESLLTPGQTAVIDSRELDGKGATPGAVGAGKPGICCPEQSQEACCGWAVGFVDSSGRRGRRPR
ncbi:hypothetical protein BSKO_02718 [Bryopsis sp. KO-2023]|nr:hypothetical protein BSKO_02718 [Bryopsis sp. KO-2023]